MILDVVCPPSDHKKVPPGLDGVAVKVALCPPQMEVLFTLTVGGLATVTTT